MLSANGARMHRWTWNSYSAQGYSDQHDSIREYWTQFGRSNAERSGLRSFRRRWCGRSKGIRESSSFPKRAIGCHQSRLSLRDLPSAYQYHKISDHNLRPRRLLSVKYCLMDTMRLSNNSRHQRFRKQGKLMRSLIHSTSLVSGPDIWQWDRVRVSDDADTPRTWLNVASKITNGGGIPHGVLHSDNGAFSMCCTPYLLWSWYHDFRRIR